MGWTGEHKGFVVEEYYENNRSVIAMQRAFRTCFALGRNASVPDRKTILLWISYLQATGSTLKRKSPGGPVIGPYFFEEGGATVTVTSDRYVEMLETFLHPKLDDVDTEDVWFQQDGATAHTA